MRDTLTYDTGGRAVIQEMAETLARRGLPVVRSFDLHSTRAGRGACVCEGHGAQTCACQLVVLLVYGRAPEPLTLVASGCDEHTDIHVIQDATIHPDPRLATEVLDILSELGLRLNALQ